MSNVVPYTCETLLLRAAGQLLRLPSPSVYTALTFLHKYRQQVPYQPSTIDWVRHRPPPPPRPCAIPGPLSQIIVAGCLYVAGKVEEAGASVNHLLNTVLQLLTPDSTSLLQSTFKDLVDALRYHRVPLQPHAVLVGDRYYSAKDKLLHAEQLLLRRLRFDLLVDDPYKYCLNYCKSAGANPALCRTAVSLLNDAALYTRLATTHAAPLLAAAALHAAAGLLGQARALPHSGGLPWWQALGVEPTQVHDLTGLLLDVLVASEPARDDADGGTGRASSAVVPARDDAGGGTGLASADVASSKPAAQAE